MILAILFIILTFLMGLLVINLLNFKFKTLTKILIAFIIGLVITTWLVFIIFLITKNLNLSILISSILLIIPLIIFRKKLNLKFKTEKFRLILLIILLVFSILVTTTSLPHYKNNEIYAGSYAWADGVFHLGILTSFSYTQNSQLISPVFEGHPLTYSFLIDFNSAILHNLGFSLTTSMIVPNIILLTSLLFLLFILTEKLTKKKSIGVIAILALVCFGGLGFLAFIQDSASSSQPFYKDLFLNTRDYTLIPGQGYEFTNFTADLMSQRTTLIGFNIILIILILFLPYLLEKKELKKSQLIFLGFLIGLLPLLHTHSYLALFILLVPLMLLYPKKDHLFLLAPAIIIALPQVLWLGNTAVENNFIKLNIGWLSKSLGHFLLFWLRNLGIGLIAITIGLYATKHKKLFYTSFILFILPNLIQFQPWVFDNIKIFKLWQIFIVILIGEGIYFIYKKSKILATIILILTISTGCLSVIYIINSNNELFNQNEIETAEWIKQNTPKESIFLTNTDKHNNLVLITGRKLYAGYNGWLWSHGIPYEIRESEKSHFLQNPKTHETVTHVLIFKKHQNYNQNISETLEKIYESQEHILLKT